MDTEHLTEIEILEISLQGRSFRVVPTVDNVDFRPFWSFFQRGLWEIDTLNMIDLVKADNNIFLDVGGWIGPTALWAAFRQTKVLTFEPDPVALKALRLNIALNPDLAKHITIVPCAVGQESGSLELFSAEPGMSETSVFKVVQRNAASKAFDNRIVVPVVDINEKIRSLSPNENSIFVKMDIEGAEFELLPMMFDSIKNYDVTISVTLHPTNIIMGSPEETMATRMVKVCKCLEPFTSLNWYVSTPEGYVKINKFDFLIQTLNDLNKDASLIISRKVY